MRDGGARATLTLPGIAGIVLTLGMSVDANVLVNERMREELRAGKSPREAVKVGYERAWSAIRDSNISTFVGGTDSLPVRHRSGQRLRGHSMRRSADRRVFMLCGYAGVVRLQNLDAQVGPN